MKLLRISKVGRSWLVSFTMLIALSVACLSSAAAEPFLNPINGHYYELVEASSGLNWYAAKASAEALEHKGLRGYLATITTVEEQEFVVNQFPQILPEYVWLGASDEAFEGWFQWITGESTGFGVGIAGMYAAWDVGEPNGGTGENCLDFANGSIGWNDEGCDRPLKFYLVEYSKPILHTYYCYGTSGIGPIPFFDPYGIKPEFELYFDASGEGDCDGPLVDVLFEDITVPFADVPQYFEANRDTDVNFDDFVNALTDGTNCTEITPDVVDSFGDVHVRGGGCGWSPISLPADEVGSILLLVGDELSYSYDWDRQFFETQHDYTITVYGQEPVIEVNDLVSFEPDPSTYSTTGDTSGCPAGYVGKFNFESTLTNISTDTLSALQVEVARLTRRNLLLTDEGLIGEGESFPVPEVGGYYADGRLSPGEFVDVPFTVCLRRNRPFQLFVNVLGVVSSSGNASFGEAAGLSAQSTASVVSGTARSAKAGNRGRPIALGKFNPRRTRTGR